jgi:hypothetical protein
VDSQKRLAVIRKKHALLDREVAEEEAFHFENAMRITEMKKQKLRLKDEITWLEKGWLQ